MLKSFVASNALLTICMIANVATFTPPTAKSDVSNSTFAMLSNDEVEFTFAGHCSNGDIYRMFSYQVDADGLAQSFYDYSGPVGMGTIKTETSPKVMANLICNELSTASNVTFD